MNIQNTLLGFIRKADRFGANKLIQDWTVRGGSENLLTEVVEPVLKSVGDEWLKDENFTLAQAYVTSRIAEDAMAAVAENMIPARVSLGTVVIGNIEEDFHSLGRQLVGTFLRVRGWQVHDLGNDVPAKVFVDQAVATGAHVIGVSAMTLSTARNILRVREEVDSRGLTPHLKIAVGGAVFCLRPDLVQEVGGDGSATNAVEAAELVARLWKEWKDEAISA